MTNNSETDLAAEYLLMQAEIVSAFSCLILGGYHTLGALINNNTFMIYDL